MTDDKGAVGMDGHNADISIGGGNAWPFLWCFLFWCGQRDGRQGGDRVVVWIKKIEHQR